MSMTAHPNNLRFSLKILDSSFFGRGSRGRNFGDVGRDGMFVRDRGFATWSLWWAGVFFRGSGRHNGYLLVVELEGVTACRALCRQFFRKEINEYILGLL